MPAAAAEHAPANPRLDHSNPRNPTDEEERTPAAPAATTAGWAWYAVGVLLVAYIFSIMDRQILTLLVGPIQKSLGVNDTLMGLLHGFTFAAFYAVMGLPIARIIDRGNRRVAIAIGIAVWSVATAASGLATDYWHLLAARIARRGRRGRAAAWRGLAARRTSSRAEKRGRAMGAFGAAGPVGAGVGLFAGGLLLGCLHAVAAGAALPGRLEPWQATFIAVGLPGVVVASSCWLFPSPEHAPDRCRKRRADRRMSRCRDASRPTSRSNGRTT